MKTFNELNDKQQHEAVQFAHGILHELMEKGIVTVEPGASCTELALRAAHNGEYNDDGKPALDGEVIEYRFLGGCV